MMFESTRVIARSLYHHWRVQLGTSASDRCRLRKQKNRCLPTKAVSVWHQLDDESHVRLVESYLEEAGSFRHIRGLDRTHAASSRTRSTPWSAVARGRTLGARKRPGADPVAPAGAGGLVRRLLSTGSLPRSGA